MSLEAARLKPNLGIAVVTHIAPGPDGRTTGNSSYQKEATFNDPTEGERLTEWLVADNLAVWLYDRSNGKVLLKQEIGRSEKKK